MSVRKLAIWIIALVAIDMLIRIIIGVFWLDVRFDIIPGLFEFKPVFNTAHSYINGLLGLGIGYWPHLAIAIFAVAVAFFLCGFARKYGSGKKLTDVAFIFLISGGLCSLIIHIVWGKCLDYIYLKPLFVFDLKDLYINAGVILVLVSLLGDKKFRAVKWHDVAVYCRSLFAKRE